MPIYEYQCEKCHDVQEILYPYEKVEGCDCGGEMRRAFLTPPAVKVHPEYRTQTFGADGKRGRINSKEQAREWGKRNGVILEQN